MPRCLTLATLPSPSLSQPTTPQRLSHHRMQLPSSSDSDSGSDCVLQNNHTRVPHAQHWPGRSMSVKTRRRNCHRYCLTRNGVDNRPHHSATWSWALVQCGRMGSVEIHRGSPIRPKESQDEFYTTPTRRNSRWPVQDGHKQSAWSLDQGPKVSAPPPHLHSTIRPCGDPP